MREKYTRTAHYRREDCCQRHISGENYVPEFILKIMNDDPFCWCDLIWYEMG